MTAADRPPIIMVSSTVYGIEELLDQIFGMLAGFGYSVWMSHKGTVPVDPSRSNFDNCLKAVENCDLFLGLITPFYGSGKEEGGMSITPQELLHAIEREKLRWFLAHDHVPFARKLLEQFRFQGRRLRKDFVFKRTSVMDDIRVLDMYEAAIRSDQQLADRTGNWVQPYHSFSDALQFVSAQFGNVERIRELMEGSRQ